MLMLVGFAAALVMVAMLGRRAAPDASLRDPRASTYLTGPSGAAALAQTLEGLGIAVERRRIPLFGVADDLAAQGRRTALAVLAPTYGMTSEEASEVARLVSRGGAVVLAGWTGVEPLLGVSLAPADEFGKGEADSVAVVPPDGIGSVPGVWTVLGRHRPGAGEAPLVRAVRVDTLIAAENRRPVAIRLEYSGGGRALIIAEPRWLLNRSLRDTDVGALVVPWFLSLGIERLVVDENHHGFGRSGALLGASWRWLWGGPPGWAMLQLLLAGLVALGALAIRFGPAIAAIPRRRRSPVEHLDALAAGLERADGRQTATELLGRGLARRLGRAGRHASRAGWARDRERWLGTLARGNDDPAARAAMTRLGWLLRQTAQGDEHVLRTAQAVEDVWEALKRPSGHAPF
jgi:hypothetical protein